MTSLNDNLFTTLLEHAVPREVGCRLRTRFGLLRARFEPDGLTELRFEPEDGDRSDGVFRKAFLDWLEGYQRMPPEEQWRYLAPRGTDFQRRTWRALLEIPMGRPCTYGALAVRLRKPGAGRAVGRAVGANPICLLLPCHRVIPRSGGIGGYRWGGERKQALLDAEAMPDTELSDLFQ